MCADKEGPQYGQSAVLLDRHEWPDRPMTPPASPPVSSGAGAVDSMTSSSTDQSGE